MKQTGKLTIRPLRILFLLNFLLSIIIFLASGARPVTAQDGTAVPPAVAKKIALAKARSLWGQVTPGTPIPCYDESGKLSAYMCPFQIGPGPFPSKEEILEGVKDGRKWVEEVKRNFYGKGERQAPEIVTAFQETLRTAMEKELGAGQFGAVYVSARYDRNPIPLVSHYLPPYFTKADLAHAKARRALGDETPISARYYFLGHRGQYFEFVSGSKRKFIHAQSLEQRDELEGGGRPSVSEERRKEIEQAWLSLGGFDNATEGGE